MDRDRVRIEIRRIDEKEPKVVYRGNDAFCVIGNIGGELKDAATRCVLRPVNVSKCVCGRGSAPDPDGGAYCAPQALYLYRLGGRGNGKGE